MAAGPSKVSIHIVTSLDTLKPSEENIYVKPLLGVL